MATTIIYPTIDGYVAVNRDDTFANLRAETSLNLTSGSNASFPPGVQLSSSGTTNQFQYVIRGLLEFDTSAVGAGEVVSEATLTLTPGFLADAFGDAPKVHVAGGSLGTPATIANTDYANIERTSFAEVAVSALTFNVPYDWDFNALGRSYIDTEGTTVLSLQSSYDINNAPPTWIATRHMYAFFYGEEDSGTTRDPVLTVTHDSAGSGFTPVARPVSVASSLDFSSLPIVEKFGGNIFGGGI